MKYTPFKTLSFLLSLTSAVCIQSAEAKVITFWVRQSSVNFVSPLVKAYNSTHADKIQTLVIPDTDLLVRFATVAKSEDAPDLIAVDLVHLPALSKAGLLTDVTATARSLPYFKQLSPSHIRLGTFSNRLYALPFSAEGSILLYNKTLFRQAGLDPERPPTSWTQIEQYSRKITALGNGAKGYYFAGACAGCNVFTFLPYVWASGTDLMGSGGKSATIDTPAMRSALSFYRRLWTSGQIPVTAEKDQGEGFLNTFLTGKIGMAPSGAFALGVLRTKYPKLDVGVTYLPGPRIHWSSFAGGDSIGVPQGSRNAKEALAFIKWCLEEAQQVELFAKNGSLPVRTDLARSCPSSERSLAFAV